MKDGNRNKAISTKLSDEEFARLEAFVTVKGRNMGEWMRDVLLGQLNPVQEIILVELLGLRDILINLFHAHSRGAELTVEYIEEIMAQADANKRSAAIERLQAGKELLAEKEEVGGNHNAV